MTHGRVPDAGYSGRQRMGLCGTYCSLLLDLPKHLVRARAWLNLQVLIMGCDNRCSTERLERHHTAPLAARVHPMMCLYLALRDR